MKLIPLFTILAANPEKSPIIPPPAEIKISLLLKLFFSKSSTRIFTLPNDFKFSFTEYS